MDSALLEYEWRYLQKSPIFCERPLMLLYTEDVEKKQNITILVRVTSVKNATL